MAEKESIKISLGTTVCIFIIILLIVGLGVVYYLGFIKNNERISELEVRTAALENENDKIEQENKDLKDDIKNTYEKTVKSEIQDSTQSVYKYSDLKAFWSNFRSTILSGNYSEMKKFVKFPLQTKGPADASPIVNVSEENFEKTFKKFLQQYDGMKENETEYDWIKNHEMPKMLGGSEYDNAGNYIDLVRLEDDNKARFADMVVEKNSEGYWYVTLIYYIEN